MPTFLFALALMLQGAPAAKPASALAFLRKVTQRYANAKSYHLEVTDEQASWNELSRSWQKFLLTAIVAPGGRYRYEGRTGFGSAVIVSNGNKKWDYHLEAHQYTETTVSPGEENGHHVIPQVEMGVIQAKWLTRNIEYLSTELKSASFLPDQTIVLDGRSMECRVVHFTEADFRTARPGNKIDETVWIDKARNVIVKTSSHGDSYTMIDGRTRVPIKTKQMTVYHVVRLDEKEPESSFTFSPPADAKLVKSFPLPAAMQGFEKRAAHMLGHPAPEAHFKSKGKDILLSSYRGKPVFIGFWATWCGPCVDLEPELKDLYAQTHDKGLVWIGVDKGEDSATMEAFLRQQHIPWPNYDDTNGALSKAFACSAIPLGVLINANGKVIFYRVGYSVAELRAAIAKLGPQFSSLEAGPQATATTPVKP